MVGLLGRMPISVLTLEAALLGAALRGLELAKVPRRDSSLRSELTTLRSE